MDKHSTSGHNIMRIFASVTIKISPIFSFACLVDEHRFDSVFGWLRTTQHCGCNKWLPTCQWLQSTVEGHLELVE